MMELTLDTILYKLRDLQILAEINSERRRTFSGVKHIGYSHSGNGQHLLVGLLSEALRKTADQNAVYLCVCDIPDYSNQIPAGMHAVFFPLQYHPDYLFDRVLEVFEELKDWDKALHVSSLEGKGLDYLVQISEQQINNPMLILDTSFNLLEHTHNIPVEYNMFRETILNGYSPSSAINHLEVSGLFQQLRASEQPIIHQAAASDTETNIYFKLAYGGLELGFAVVYCGKHVPDPGYVDLLSLFFDNVNLYFRQYFYPKRAGNFMYEGLLQNLMSGDVVQLQQIEDQTAYVRDIKPTSIYRLLRIFLPGKTLLPLSFLARELSMAVPFLKPFIYDSAIYALREYPSELIAEQGETAEELATIETVLAKPNLKIAASGVFSAITDLSLAKVQCEAALRMGDPNSRYLRYEDCKSFHLIEAASSAIPLDHFLSSRYLRLLRYDQENSTELCPLLKCHLSTMLRVSDTARKLFLHRNTVLNRLQKIEEILGSDLMDEYVQNELRLSFLVADYLSEKR